MERQSKETLYYFLKRRATELTHEIAALQGEIDVRKNELAHVESAKRQIDMSGIRDAAQFGKFEGVEAKGIAGEITGEAAPENASERRPFFQYEGLTIKQLIVKALTDHFHDGATAIELRDFIRNAYGREIDRASLTPQMSRLKDEKILEYLPRSEESDGAGNRFIVAKSFVSISRRFPVGSEIVIPADEGELNKLKRELEPRGLDDLIERRWIVAPSSGGYWKLNRNHDPLDVARLILKTLWLDLGFRSKGANRAQIRESLKQGGVDLSEQQIADGVRLLNSRALLKNKGGPQNWRLTVKALEGLSQDRALVD